MFYNLFGVIILEQFYLPPPPPTLTKMIYLYKHYVDFNVRIDLAELPKNVRHISIVDDNYVAISDGIFYVFQSDRVSVCAIFNGSQENTEYLSSVRRNIGLTLGVRPTGKTTRMVFVTSVLMDTSNILALDTLHFHLCRNPIPDTVLNIFHPEKHPDIILKISPYKDGFVVTFHIKPTGKCLIVCDATRVTTGYTSNLTETFKERAEDVMSSLKHVINWNQD